MIQDDFIAKNGIYHQLFIIEKHPSLDIQAFRRQKEIWGGYG